MLRIRLIMFGKWLINMDGDLHIFPGSLKNLKFGKNSSVTNTPQSRALSFDPCQKGSLYISVRQHTKQDIMDP